MSKAKKAILITVIVLLLLAVLILGIIWGILNSGYLPGNTSISLDKLSTVMADDIVYLSDDFLTSNNLERVGFLGNVDYVNDVMINYNVYKVDNTPNFSARVENLDGCSYYLSSKEYSDGIPVNVDVYFSTKKDKNHKYNQEYNGYKYCADIVGDKYTYFVKTTPRKGATCIMTLRIFTKEDVADKYTEEEKSARAEQIFKSAVDNIVYYKDIAG